MHDKNVSCLDAFQTSLFGDMKIMTLQEIRRLKAETELKILEILKDFEAKSEGAVTMALVHRNQVIGKEHGDIVAVNLEVKVL